MSSTHLHVLAVAGSLGKHSVTRVVLRHAADQLTQAGCHLDFLDFTEDPLPLFDPDSAYHAPMYPALKARVERADVLLLGTPDYHGGMSSALKNFLDHFWREFAGKLFAPIVASHEKGLTVADQIRTVARQCYAWALPYAVSFTDKADLQDGRIASDALRDRLAMLVRDIQVYGTLLARQREHDLAGRDPGFLARYRSH
jgi:FMN reductase